MSLVLGRSPPLESVSILGLSGGRLWSDRGSRPRIGRVSVRFAVLAAAADNTLEGGIKHRRGLCPVTTLGEV